MWSNTISKSNSGEPEKDVFIFQNQIPDYQKSSVSSLDALSTHDQQQIHWQASLDSSPPEQPTYYDRIRKFWRDTVEDLRTIRWIHNIKRIATHLTTWIVTGILIWLIIFLAQPRSRDQSACTPDGSFYVDPDLGGTWFGRYNPWQGNALFAIDLALGDMDFSTAKGVDILWDMGFGRGLQGLISIISYIVCTKSLSRLMERTPVPLRTFEAVTLQSDSFRALWKIIRDIFHHQSLRAILIVAWIVGSTVILLSFQTLASAMTGYIAKVSAFVQTGTGERVPASQFKPVQYIIHDGSRLGAGFYDDFRVTMPEVNDPTINAYYVETYTLYGTNTTYGSLRTVCSTVAPLRVRNDGKMSFGWAPPASTMTPSQYTNCSFLWHVSEYAFNYGFLGLQNTNSTFNNSNNIISLASPTLNISAYFGPSYHAFENTPWSTVPYGYYWKDSKGQQPFRKANPQWSYGQNLYNLTSLNYLGACQQSDLFNIRYQWGFSTMLLLVFAALMLIWIIGTYAMYMDSFINSSLDVSQRDIGLKRAVLDVHTTMRRDLNTVATDPLGNSKLQKLVKNNRLDYTELVSSEAPNRARNIAMWWKNFNIRKWARDEIIWLTLLLIFTILTPLSYMTYPLALWWSPIASPVVWFGTFLTICVGRANRARWILFWVFFLAFLIYDGVNIGFWYPHRRYYGY